MSAQYDAYGNPASVGEPGREDAVYDTVGIAQSISDVRTLALYDFMRMRMQRLVTVAVPAAGADWTVTVPATMLWEPLHIVATLTTSAVVANRGPRIQFSAGGTPYVGVPSPLSATASATWRFSWAPGGVINSTSPGGSGVANYLPAVAMQSGDVLAVSTGALDAGDAWSAITVLVREWSVGQLYWAADLLGRELGFESLTDLPASTPLPEGTGQPIPVSPVAR